MKQHSMVLAAMILGGALLAYSPAAMAQGSTKVVVLGSGWPGMDPDRAGPATAVVVNGAVYLVDCGPGVVRRAAAAVRAGNPELQPTALNRVFITHLHSDHTIGYPDLILTPWTMGRTEPLDAYGPIGLRDMTDDLLKAWSKDIDVRTNGLEHANHTGDKVIVHEIKAGVVFKDSNVTVSAFLVAHGSWDEAVGYRFQTADRVIVFSGDTHPTDSVVAACNGCDLLFHEAYYVQTSAYFADFHTSAFELGRIATAAHPKLLVLYHQGPGGHDAEELAALRRSYAGPAVIAHDLNVY